MTADKRTLWTFVVTSIALFMVVLDNLVVSTAIPVIRTDIGASLEDLEWTVNAFILTFAVFLLTGAALGDRYGRKRVSMVGVAIFAAGSAAAALAPSPDWLIAARALQGLGGAIVTPLTLTILSAAVPAERRGVALGAWSGIAGLAVAMGPLVGGAVVDGISWPWIFWINVPVGIVLLALATQLQESRGPDKALDIPGLAPPALADPGERLDYVIESWSRPFAGDTRARLYREAIVEDDASGSNGAVRVIDPAESGEELLVGAKGQVVAPDFVVPDRAGSEDLVPGSELVLKTPRTDLVLALARRQVCRTQLAPRSRVTCGALARPPSTGPAHA